MDQFQYSLESAHPNAQKLMQDNFFWSPIEESGPFGSDDGWEAAYGFRKWRIDNNSASPLVFLKELLESWHLPAFDSKELDTVKIREYISRKEALDESTIRERMRMLKEMYRTSGDSSMHLSEDQLREAVISSSNSMNDLYLLSQDNAIIGTGFAQFVLEGHMDPDIRFLTAVALKRQLLPLLLNRYEEKHVHRRQTQLTKMLEVVNKLKS